MKLRWIPTVCSMTLLSARAGPMPRGAGHGGGPALILGLGVAAGVAIAALSAPPGHSMHALPREAIIIHSLPSHPDTLFFDAETYYVVEGVYYQRSGNNYMVVESPISSAQANSEGYEADKHYAALPDGAKPVKIDNTQYFVYGGLFFLPQSSDGQVTYLAVKLN